jgi:uncharacterized protein
MDEAADGQRDTIAFLADPATYGTRVERIDTHCSILFLAGEHAYKLKRAVRFSYLDYSTVERRRAMCEAELALNRRTAPDLYESVSPIVRREDGWLAFGGPGTVLDWVVVMRRFPADAAFDRMANAATLAEPHVTALAVALAAFHARADVHRHAGGAAAMARVIDNNEQVFRSIAARVFNAEEITALTRESRGALAKITSSLDSRRDSGKVRQCHGDLHLRNVVLWHGKPTPFDCVEFDHALARIDVLYDLAFLLMDLEHRRLRPLANAALNAYLAAADDWDGLAALPLFLSCRAAIRAHVSGTAGDHAAAAAYFALARKFLTPAAPRLVAVGGLSGTGKSSLARVLAPALVPAPGAAVLRSDLLRKALAGVAPTDRLPAEAYAKESSDRVYALLNERARKILEAAHSVVADAVFADPRERHAIEAAAEGLCPFDAVWLEAPAAVLEERVTSRRGDASDATPDVVRAQSRYPIGKMEWRRVNAAGNQAATLAQAKAALRLP